MKKILITGASGFVGNNLINSIDKKKYDVYKFESSSNDLNDIKNWEIIPNCDYVVHLAAKTFVPESWENPSLFIKNNLTTTLNALEYCRIHKSKLILLSSYMYGEPQVKPTPESHELKVKNPYALSKFLSEYTSNFYNNFLEVDLIILRVFNIFGPQQPQHFLISKIISQIYKEKKINVKSLLPKRDYLYVDDLSLAIIKSIEYDGEHKIFNIGMGKSYSVKEIIDIIQRNLKINFDITCELKSRREEINETLADIKLAKTELNWKPNYSFEDGIKLLLSKSTKSEFI